MHSNAVTCGGLAILFLMVAWHRGRAAAIGRRLLWLLLFGAAFVLGEVYLMVLVADLKWPRVVAYLAIVSWGALLSTRARHRERAGGADVARK
jgi:hypothetical protein